ncbi:probable receptor-like protein kinase At1g33260 [Nicotiana sylvestris]|uniref:non-specific serine/threonine protein kinase n=1 Tax=Nicotiana sylvestris TaxID=4096 RepID=A0A1U7V2S9_NICSY|nr:PREDICTED: probable receptor-like protein kinase At1g33260 [Nicotiana sylvestris]
MEASPSNIGKSNKLSKAKKVSNTNDFSLGNSPFVCGWWGSLLTSTSSCCSFPSYYYYFFTFFFCTASSSFPVASQPLATPPTAVPPLYNHKYSRVIISTSAAFGILLFLFFCAMALFKCLGFKLKRRSGVLDSKVAGDEEENKDCSKKFGVRRFTCDEVEKFTMNLSRSRLIAYGGFSTVYLAQFPDSLLGAVKIIDLSSERFQKVYQQELDILLQIQHENIVKFLGYCDNGEEGMLVFEYISNGTLQEKLHGTDARKMSWKNRMAIAFQLAKAIEYLHDKCTLPIVHGDIKASNVLLDKKFNCKLCDFGSAKMGFSSTILPPNSSTNRMMLGSPGYTDPHYLRTGIASKKNDIYSFGIIILELISGFEALSSDSGERLISKAGNILRDASKVAEMVDSRLNGAYDLEEAKAMVSLAGLCLGDSPSLRPSASEILDTITSRIPSIFSLSKNLTDY